LTNLALFSNPPRQVRNEDRTMLGNWRRRRKTKKEEKKEKKR